MFVPHNFGDHDASRESVQGVRVQLKGKNSGGFAGEWSTSGDLRSRVARRGDEKNEHKVKYFGATYEEGVKLPLEAFEPDLRKFVSEEIAVTDLTFNGTAAGVWEKEVGR